MTKRHLLHVGAMLVALTGASAAVSAAPLAPAASEPTVNSDITTVQYRGYRGGGYYGRPYGYGYRPYAYRGGGYGYRPFVGFGIGAGIVAGAIIANRVYAPRPGYYYDTYDYRGPYYYPSDYRGDPREVCARHFRSFEWDTGLYTTYHGEKRMCPYLGV